MSIRKDIVWRVGLVYIGVVIVGFLIVGKILWIQIVEGSKWKAKAESISLQDIIIEPDRGDIYAVDGRILASSVPYYDIRIDFRADGLTGDIFNDEVDSLAYCMSKLFRDKSKNAYKQELINGRNEGNRYYLLKKRINYNQLQELKTFPIFKRGPYKGGFIVEQESIRLKPHQNLAARTIGDLNESGNVVGLEGAYNNELVGVEGLMLKQKMSNGSWRPVKGAKTIEPKDGKDIITCIDLNIQDVAQNALYKQLVKHDADYGTAILMEVETGEIKAIANLGKISEGVYAEDYNYAVGSSTEPGSTFKLASMIVALEDGVVNLDDTIDCGKGELKYFDRIMTDSHEDGYGKISARDVFVKSSNVGTSKIIYDNYKNHPELFIDRLYAMGLNRRLDVEIQGEGYPEIKTPEDKNWSGTSLPWMSIGYEIELTPLQILTFYNAVANDGKMVKPKFVKAISYHGEIEKEFKSEIINPAICSKSTLKKVKGLLENVVEYGTAKNLKNETYRIAGKTGTAQIAQGSKGYNKKNYQASFCGYFPAENPKYSCIVVVAGPSRSVYYGNVVAGPIFKEISDKVYSTNLYLLADVETNEDDPNIPYSKNGNLVELSNVLADLKIPSLNEGINSEWVSTQSTDSTVLLFNRYTDSRIVPNVINMGLKDAVFLLENAGLIVRFNGRGSVKQQSISPGTKVSKGRVIELKMSFS